MYVAIDRFERFYRVWENIIKFHIIKTIFFLNLFIRRVFGDVQNIFLTSNFMNIIKRIWFHVNLFVYMYICTKHLNRKVENTTNMMFNLFSKIHIPFLFSIDFYKCVVLFAHGLWQQSFEYYLYFYFFNFLTILPRVCLISSKICQIHIPLKRSNVNIPNIYWINVFFSYVYVGWNNKAKDIILSYLTFSLKYDVLTLSFSTKFIL